MSDIVLPHYAVIILKPHKLNHAAFSKDKKP